MVKRNIEYFLNKIPEKYRSSIEIVGDDLGGETKIKYMNKCGCISDVNIKALCERKQFDLCKKCFNLKRNISKDFQIYINRIDSQYHRNIIDLGIDSGYHRKVKFTFPGCGHYVICNIGSLAKRQILKYCKKCITKDMCKRRALTFNDFLNKLPEQYRKRVELIGDFSGRYSFVIYSYPCGCKEKIILNKLINRKSLDSCKNCVHPVCLSSDEIIDSLVFLENPVIISGYPGNRSTIIIGKCKRCGSIINDSYFNLQQYYSRNGFPGCKICNTKSFHQLEVYDFVKSICSDAIESDNKTIKFNNDDSRYKELDIFCKKDKFAIEFNGLYFHSEKYKDDKLYHYKKTVACRELGISFHIWEDKWCFKKDIVQSMIRVRLNNITQKIFARKTKVVELSNEDGKRFFDENHLDGAIGCKKTWGLVINGELVEAISVREPNHQNKKYSGYIEVARSATKKNIIVIGGESKLLNIVEQWARNNKYCGILNYVDSDLGSFPNERWKFEYVGETSISYFYIKHNSLKRFARQKFQASNGKTEKEIVNEQGMIRVNTNTNMIYIYNFG